jgi:hypothetical protein
MIGTTILKDHINLIQMILSYGHMGFASSETFQQQILYLITYVPVPDTNMPPLAEVSS